MQTAAPAPASQPPADQPALNVVLNAATIDSLAALHVELVAFRGKMQGELADPRAKKADVQATLRDKLQEGTAQLLKSHNLTEAEFQRRTRLVSTDDAMRKQFEEAVNRRMTSK